MHTWEVATASARKRGRDPRTAWPARRRADIRLTMLSGGSRPRSFPWVGCSRHPPPPPRPNAVLYCCGGRARARWPIGRQTPCVESVGVGGPASAAGWKAAAQASIGGGRRRHPLAHQPLFEVITSASDCVRGNLGALRQESAAYFVTGPLRGRCRARALRRRRFRKNPVTRAQRMLSTRVRSAACEVVQTPRIRTLAVIFDPSFCLRLDPR
jgi:hypothetical protein